MISVPNPVLFMITTQQLASANNPLTKQPFHTLQMSPSSSRARWCIFVATVPRFINKKYDTISNLALGAPTCTQSHASLSDELLFLARSIHFPDAAFAPSLETSTTVRILPGAVGCIVMCTCRVHTARGTLSAGRWQQSRVDGVVLLKCEMLLGEIIKRGII